MEKVEFNVDVSENLDSKNAVVPKFITYGVPVGKKNFTKLVRSSKNESILTHHVAYEFGATVSDIAVQLWVLCLKMYNDSNFKELKEFQGKDLVAAMLSEQHTSIFSVSELGKRLFGERTSSKRILKYLDNISDIKIRIVAGGREVGSTRFLDSPYLHNDKKHVQFNFNSLILYMMANDYRLMNMDKYLSLKGSKARLYLVMQGWKRYQNDKGEYVKISNQELCEAMNVDINGANTRANLKKDFDGCGIKFTYYKYGDYWHYV